MLVVFIALTFLQATLNVESYAAFFRSARSIG